MNAQQADRALTLVGKLWDGLEAEGVTMVMGRGDLEALAALAEVAGNTPSWLLRARVVSRNYAVRAALVDASRACTTPQKEAGDDADRGGIR